MSEQQKENRVSRRFRQLVRKGERALICYVVAGYPDLQTTKQIVNALVSGGADIIEIGIPFSDPMADGPTIQAASGHALAKGVTPEKALHLVKEIRRKHPEMPLLAMTYSNILVSTGIEKFLILAEQHGIDGFILPDLPVEEADDFIAASHRLGLSLVFFASPNTSEERLRKIVDSSTGFLYLVSVYGITGARKSFEDYTLDAVKKVKRLARSKVPVAVGFGISTPAHAKFMIDAGADAVIIGSAIIDRIARAKGSKKKMLKDLREFAISIKKVCKV